MASHHSHALNEAACPVELELLALLLRTDDPTRRALIGKIDPTRRAKLALFCYNRTHLRSLSFQVASQCEMRDLRLLGGALGDVIATQSLEAPTAAEETGGGRRRGVTLARSARG